MFEIGNSLREARLRQGADLIEVEQATKIRSKYLRALEDERFELLPAQTYVKGFLRSYAEYLGLDGQLYVDEYNTRYVPDEEAPVRTRRSSPSRAHRRVESSVLLIALAGIAAVTALVIVAWKFGGSEPTRIAGVGRQVTPPARRVAPPAAQQPAKRPWIKLRLTAARGDSHIVVYRTSERGRLLFEGTLERGRTRQFTGPRVWMQVSVPENLVARVNGRRAALPGDGSQPIIALATPRGIAAAPGA
jgi:hypothetical protein